MLILSNKRFNYPLELDFRDGTVIRLSPGESREADIKYMGHPVVEAYRAAGDLQVVFPTLPEVEPTPVILSEPEVIEIDEAEPTPDKPLQEDPPSNKSRKTRNAR